MKFVVNRLKLMKALRLITLGSRSMSPVANALRLEASNGKLKLTTPDSGTEISAFTCERGVVFMVWPRFRKLISSYRGKKELTIEIGPSGLRVSRLTCGDAVWYAIFDDPSKAPKEMSLPEIRAATPELPPDPGPYIPRLAPPPPPADGTPSIRR